MAALRLALGVVLLGLCRAALAAAPVVSTTSVSSITATSAVLNGSADPNAESTTGWFRISATNPGTCNDTFGTRVPATGGTDLGSGVGAVPYSSVAAGLLPGSTYWFCAVASNGSGVSFGAPLVFTTPATAPVTSTVAATLVTTTSAQLNGASNPRAAAATGWFRFSTTSPGTCNDTFGARVPASGGTSLGSGNAAVSFYQPVTGLSPGATYYYCAIASNMVGTSFGSVFSFTTPSPPAATTLAATSVGGTTVTLNGSANPNAAASVGWFRYSTTNPVTCNDTFGTRAPSSGGAALGVGTSPVAFSQALSALTPATTYYYCAIASNGAGTGFGAVLSFTTSAVAPTVTTQPVQALAATSADLVGVANPGGAVTTGWFRYSTVNPGTCDQTFGTRAPASGGLLMPGVTFDWAFVSTATGLSPATTYYYCALASSSEGTAAGSVLSFTTPPLPPAVSTPAASAVASRTATLNGVANPGGGATTGWFRWATANPGACSDTFGTRAPSTGGTALGAGTADVPFSQAIAGLAPATTYYACAIASNASGKGFGGVVSFTTAAERPTATTAAATAVGSDAATLNGSAVPGGAATTGWFRYAATDPGTCDDTFGARAPASGGTALGAGTADVPFSAGLVALAPGTTYHYCAIASSSAGTSFGTVLGFTTAAAVPAVTTSPAAAVTSREATLNGAANPGGGATTGWFRYATTSPGTCTDSFGTRAPASGGTALGAGTSSVAFERTMTGLAPGTTYYACAIASNASGTGLGGVVSFTTAAEAPAASTAAATAVGSRGATLNGAANPGGAETTGWFRFATANPGTCDDTFGTRAPASGGPALGAGTSDVPFSEAVTGLAPATTYYACAIASNASGTRFGGVVSFTTAAEAPTVTTSPPVAVTASGATLAAAASPGGADTTGWFRVDTSDPGACSDGFGTRVPASGGAALGAGTSSVPFVESVTELAPGTTYYVCAVATNAAGTSFGGVRTFTTAAAPTVTTEPATAVTSGGATLDGSAAANGAETTAWFRIDAADAGTCSDAFGTRVPASGGTVLGPDTGAAAFSEDFGGLEPATTYWYCAVAENAAGKRFGDLVALTTAAAAPEVTTAAATGVANDAATLNGSADPNGAATTAWFRYAADRPTTCDDAFGTRAPSPGVELGAGNEPIAWSAPLAGLARGATYYYCAIAENAQGKSFGAVQAVVPGSTSPVVATQAATAIGGSGATLAGTADPNGTAATGWFRYGAGAPATCDDAFGTRAPATGGTSLGGGVGPVAFEEPLTGLEPNLTYSYCAAAANAGGATFGEIRSFTTASLPPVVTTVAPVVAAGGEVTLEGLANPRGTETTTWFRVGTASPGGCDDTYGTRWPQTGGTAVGAGRANASYGEIVTGLAPGTYFVCAIGSNAAGLGVGAAVSFDVPRPPPDGGSGCGCRSGSPSGSGAGSFVVLLLLAAAPRRRRVR